MKLVHASLESCFTDEYVNVLQADDPRAFRSFYDDIKNSLSGESDAFIMSDKDETVNLSKVAIMIDPININTADKKINTKLIAQLADVAQEKFAKESAYINDGVNKLLCDLQTESSVEIDWDCEFPIVALLKAFGVSFKCDHASHAERLFAFLTAMIELCSIKCVFFVNLKSCMTQEELSEIYKFLRYNKIFALTLETSSRDKLEEEFRVIIDKDLCEIVG